VLLGWGCTTARERFAVDGAEKKNLERVLRTYILQYIVYIRI